MSGIHNILAGVGGIAGFPNWEFSSAYAPVIPYSGYTQVAADDAGGVYTTYYGSDAARFGGIIEKYSSVGAYVSGRIFGNIGGTFNHQVSNPLVVGSNVFIALGMGLYVAVVKLDLNLNVVWASRSLVVDTIGNGDIGIYHLSLTTDGSGSIFCISDYSLFSGSGMVSKINASTGIWSDALVNNDTSTVSDASFNGTSIVQVTGYGITPISPSLVAGLTVFCTNQAIYAGAIDSSGNVYGLTDNGGFSYLTKLTSAGSKIWERRISGAGAVSRFSLDLDDVNGLLYCSLSSTSGGTLIVFDASGNTIFSRTFYIGSAASLFYSVRFSMGKIYCFVPKAPGANGNVELAAVDKTGAGAGSYGGLSYSTGGVTITNTTVSIWGTVSSGLSAYGVATVLAPNVFSITTPRTGTTTPI
jgi:hypothetical protein